MNNTTKLSKQTQLRRIINFHLLLPFRSMRLNYFSRLYLEPYQKFPIRNSSSVFLFARTIFLIGQSNRLEAFSRKKLFFLTRSICFWDAESELLCYFLWIWFQHVTCKRPGNLLPFESFLPNSPKTHF